jgi:hypothetical protein
MVSRTLPSPLQWAGILLSWPSDRVQVSSEALVVVVVLLLLFLWTPELLLLCHREPLPVLHRGGPGHSPPIPAHLPPLARAVHPSGLESQVEEEGENFPIPMAFTPVTAYLLPPPGFMWTSGF